MRRFAYLSMMCLIALTSCMTVPPGQVKKNTTPAKAAPGQVKKTTGSKSAAAYAPGQQKKATPSKGKN